MDEFYFKNTLFIPVIHALLTILIFNIGKQSSKFNKLIILNYALRTKVFIYEMHHHYNFFFNFQRKNQLNNRHATPKAARIATDSHSPTSKLRRAMLLGLYSTSFWVSPEKAYLNGDMYWIQPIHPARFDWFLKNPEKMAKGNMMSNAPPLADLESLAMLPANSPIDMPLKLPSRSMR
jgi:hypothetical protein